jgi:hypothetical protein
MTEAVQCLDESVLAKSYTAEQIEQANKLAEQTLEKF